MKTNEHHYQNLIIGFGKGGKTLAAYLAKQGEKVAIVEKSEMMYGGSCINIACIPTKSLIVNAEKKIPYAKAFQAKNDLTAFLRAKNFEKLDGLDLATVIPGEASFVSAHQIKVKQRSNTPDLTITADRIFINTGSLPAIPEIPGLASSKKVFTSTSLLDQAGLPDKLIIIGAGFIGLEFADMYAKFGAEVIVLNNNKEFLPKEDKDIADEMYEILSAKGIQIIGGAQITQVSDQQNNQVQVSYKNAENKLVQINANAILMATGRKPNIDHLNVDAAGVKLDKKGYVLVDEHLKTSQPHIWAIGDINGGPQFTYISLDDFRIIRGQLFGGDYTSTRQRKQVAFSVFTSPPMSHIGLREKEAIEKGYQIKVVKLAAASIPRARILNETQGLLKTIVDEKTNKIIGCTLLCVDSSEMINTVQLAMNADLDYQVLRDTIYTHPSMTEAFNDLYALI